MLNEIAGGLVKKVTSMASSWLGSFFDGASTPDGKINPNAAYMGPITSLGYLKTALG